MRTFLINSVTIYLHNLGEVFRRDDDEEAAVATCEALPSTSGQDWSAAGCSIVDPSRVFVCPQQWASAFH